MAPRFSVARKKTNRCRQLKCPVSSSLHLPDNFSNEIVRELPDGSRTKSFCLTSQRRDGWREILNKFTCRLDAQNTAHRLHILSTSRRRSYGNPARTKRR